MQQKWATNWTSWSMYWVSRYKAVQRSTRDQKSCKLLKSTFLFATSVDLVRISSRLPGCRATRRLVKIIGPKMHQVAIINCWVNGGDKLLNWIQLYLANHFCKWTRVLWIWGHLSRLAAESRQTWLCSREVYHAYESRWILIQLK